MSNIQVIKRDGTSEEFSYDKLVASIAKSGIPIDKSNAIADNVRTWIESVASEGKITSTSIRDKIIKEMSVEFPAEADSYRVFKVN